MSKTLFVDIDGVIIHHQTIWSIHNSGILHGAQYQLLKWHNQGYKIILTTGRTEVMRKITEKFLVSQDILYDQLVMGLGSGVRILINDIDPKFPNVNKAVAINLTRNAGLVDMEDYGL